MIGSRRGDVLLVAVLVLIALCGWLLGSGRGASPAAAAPSQATPTEPAREGVQVSAEGTVSGRPDVLRLDLAVETSRTSVGRALADANAAINKIRDLLRNRGIAAADLQTSNVDISPEYDSRGRTITAYRVHEGLTVKIRDLDRAGEIIDQAVRAGGNSTRINGVSFAIEDDDALLADARRKAFAAAKAKAGLYAEEAGRSLGAVVNISEQLQLPAPVYAARAASMAMADAAMPIEAGQQKLTVTVTAEWRFG